MLKRIIIIFSFAIITNLSAQDKKYYFYNPENDFGSDLLFNPLTLMINGGFDMLRNGGHNKNIFELKYGLGYKNIISNLKDPFTNIKAYGWNKFISQEVWNFKLNKDEANFIPNIVDHTIGNGMQYAKMEEWLDYHNYPMPKLFSFLITTSYQVTNEVLENGRYQGPNIDSIADIYIFNTLGFLIFEFDAVKYFFSKTLPMYEWNLQPMFNINNNYLENAGQQYIVKKELPIKNISGFVYWGLNGIAGLSYQYNEIHNFSIGAGQVTNKIRDNYSHGLRFFSPDLDGALAFFYDKNNSLLLSALLTGPRIPNLRINTYPGLISFGSFSPGIFLGVGKWDNFIIGINFTHYIPFSFALGKEIR